MTAVPRPSYKGTTSPASRRGSRSHDSPFSPRLTRETLSSPISPLLQIRRNRLSLHRLSPYPPLRMGFRWGEIDYGEMAEWSIAAVLKTVELRGSGGSNPSLSAKRLQSDCKMVVREAFKTRVNRCRTWSYNDFSLYAVHRPDGLPLGSNSHQSVKFCYRNCYTNRGVAISVAVTAK